MIFNREAEVAAKPRSSPISPGDLEAEGGTSHPLDRFLNDDFVKGDEKIGDIFTGATVDAAMYMGVLADIVILDRITGQSISHQAYEYAKRRFALLVRQGLAYEEDDPQLAEGEMTTEHAAEVLWGEGEGQKNLISANIYNSAFLVPNPIRVVFSQNFMVDGYVNQVTVTFQKFSPEMIPVVATVDISMHAIYQGFARRRSAFTTFLELQQVMEEYNSEGDPDTNRDPDRDTQYGSGLVTAGAVGYAGYVNPMFTGFDHSPQEKGDTDGGMEIKDIVLKGDDVRNDGEVDVSHGFEFKENGISFAVFSRLYDTALGREIARQISKLNQDGTQAADAARFQEAAFKAKVYTGLQIRARIVTHGSRTNPADAKSDMAALFSGGNLGFDEYRPDSVFFGDWTVEQRNNLLQAGYDTMGSGTAAQTVAKSAFGTIAADSGQFSGGVPYYTQSFPILNDGATDPSYGDQLYMRSFEYNSVDIHWQADTEGAAGGKVMSGTPFAHMTLDESHETTRWGPTEADDDVPADPIKGYLANGFYDTNESSGHYPFQRYLRLVHNDTPGSPSWFESGSGNDVILEIEYQINLMFKVMLRHGDAQLLSDTGWLVVQPRWKPVAYVDKGIDGSGLKDDNANAHHTSGYTTNTHMTTGLTTTHWIRPRGVSGGIKNLNMHFDGYDKDPDGGGIHKWPRTLYENRMSGRAAYFRQGHEEHGEFNFVEPEA
jgi:hypothetical protein